jgi:hypothetical protein
MSKSLDPKTLARYADLARTVTRPMFDHSRSLEHQLKQELQYRDKMAHRSRICNSILNV